MNEYTSVGGTARAHSDNGNLRDDGRNTFVFDYKNRLIGAFDKATGNPTAAYLYYCDNRRAKKIVYSQVSPGQVQSQERYFYDGSQVVEETDDPGNTLLTWVYSPVYVDEPVQMVRSGSHSLGAGTFYLHQNARADVVAVTDAAGAVVERRLFDDYGRSFDGVTKQAVSGSAVGNVYGFQGRRLDSETGLLYFRARYYDSATGRFVQRDPVWDPGNFGNQYSFVGNSPVSGLDPEGLSPDDVNRSIERLAKGGDNPMKAYKLFMAEKKAGKLGQKASALYNQLDKLSPVHKAYVQAKWRERQYQRADGLTGKIRGSARKSLGLPADLSKAQKRQLAGDRRKAVKAFQKVEKKYLAMLAKVQQTAAQVHADRLADLARGGRLAYAAGHVDDALKCGSKLKVIPGLGRLIALITGVALFSNKAEAKGTGGAVIDTLYDVTPLLGEGKALYELSGGEMVPNRGAKTMGKNKYVTATPIPNRSLPPALPYEVRGRGGRSSGIAVWPRR